MKSALPSKSPLSVHIQNFEDIHSSFSQDEAIKIGEILYQKVFEKYHRGNPENIAIEFRKDSECLAMFKYIDSVDNGFRLVHTFEYLGISN